jgi:Tfp pilus assembly protein PilF
MRKVLLVVLTLALGACAHVEPGTTPGLDTETPVSEKPAVNAFVQEARTQTQAGELDAAARAYERALRIEPRNALLWHYLAQVRLQQGKLDQAESLAAKSDTLAGSNRPLRGSNWRLIGDARAKKGDNLGADAAFGKAATFEQ